MSKQPAALPGALQFIAVVYFFLGIAHCFAWAFLGWSGLTSNMIPFGVIYVVIGLLFHFKQYWVRYPAFLITLVGVVSAYIVFPGSQMPTWLMQVFIVVDIILLCVLFASIWKGRVDPPFQLGR